MRSSLLICVLLLALLCGFAAAKLSKKAQAKMGQHQAKPQQPVEERGRIIGDDESELEDCLEELKNLTAEEAIWEENRDECLARLAPFIVEDEMHEEWRNSNHSRAIRCLLNVTECNDANEPLVVDWGVSKRAVRSVYDESIINHPYKATELKARERIGMMDQGVYQQMLMSQSIKRQKREAFRCTLKQCRQLVAEAKFIVQSYKDNVTWCEEEIERRKWSIMTFLRFSTLWEQEWTVCEPIAEKCRSGKRLVSVTFQNADFNDLVYLTDFRPGWVGFTNTSGNYFYEEGQDSPSLTALRNENSSVISETFSPSGVDAVVSSGLFGEGVLTTRQAWFELFEVDAADNSHFFFAFPFDEALLPGDEGEFAVSQSGIMIFDGENFVSRPLEENINKRLSKKKKKRGVLAQELAECGCVGDRLPFYSPHEFYIPLYSSAEWDSEGSHYDRNSYPNGFAAVIIEELRWTVPYPPGIRPEVLP